MFLDGFRISGYRSFGAIEQEIRDLGKVNVFIGKNNSGKSNILRFVEQLSQLCESDRYGKGKEKPLFEPLHDLHKGTAPCDRINFSLLIGKNSAAKNVVNEVFNKLFTPFRNIVVEWREGVWIPYSITNLHNGERQFDVVALSELLKKTYSVFAWEDM